MAGPSEILAIIHLVPPRPRQWQTRHVIPPFLCRALIPWQLLCSNKDFKNTFLSTCPGKTSDSSNHSWGTALSIPRASADPSQCPDEDTETQGREEEREVWDSLGILTSQPVPLTSLTPAPHPGILGIASSTLQGYCQDTSK